jgi:hypothetical protein
MMSKKELKNKWISCNLVGKDIEKNFVELMMDFCSYNSNYRVGSYFCLSAALENVFIDLKTIYNTFNNIKDYEYDHIPNLAINYVSYRFVKNNEPVTIELDSRILNKFDRCFPLNNNTPIKVLIKRNELESVFGDLELLVINTKCFSVELRTNSIKIS